MSEEMDFRVLPSRAANTSRIFKTRWSIGIRFSRKDAIVGVRGQTEIDSFRRRWLFIRVMPLPCVVVKLVAAPHTWYPDHRKHEFSRGARVRIKTLRPLGPLLENVPTNELENRHQPGTEGKVIRGRGHTRLVKHPDGTTAVYRTLELESVN